MKSKRSLALVGGTALIVASLLFAAPALAKPAISVDWMDAMHDSPAMEQMRDQMPVGIGQQCDQMHERMSDWLEQHGGQIPGGMMDPHSGMMGGSGNMMGGSGGPMMSF